MKHGPQILGFLGQQVLEGQSGEKEGRRPLSGTTSSLASMQLCGTIEMQGLRICYYMSTPDNVSFFPSPFSLLVIWSLG